MRGIKKDSLEECIENLLQVSKAEKQKLYSFLRETNLSKALKEFGTSPIEEEYFLNKINEELPVSVNQETLRSFLRCIARVLASKKHDISYSSLFFIKARQRDLAVRLRIKQRLFPASEIFIDCLRKMERLEKEQDYWALLLISLLVNTHLTFQGLSSALSQLKWGDVDLKRGAIYFREEVRKRKFPLRVWIDPISLAILGGWKKADRKDKRHKPEEFVFPKVAGLSQPGRTYYISMWLKRIFERKITLKTIKDSSRFYSALLYSSDVVSYLGGKIYSPPSPLEDFESDKPEEESTQSKEEERNLPVLDVEVLEWEEVFQETIERISEKPSDELNFINNFYKQVLKEVMRFFPKKKGPRRKKEIKEAFEELREKVNNENLSEEVRKNTLYFLDFAEYSLETKWKEATIRSYLSHLISIPVDFWFSDFSLIDEEDLEEIFTIFRTISSLRNYKPALKAFFDFLSVKKGLKVEINWKALKTKKEVKLPEHFITREKFLRILMHLNHKIQKIRKSENTQDDTFPRRSKLFALRVAVYLGYKAGLRISEVTNLKIKDIWFEGDKLWVFIEKGKTHSAKRRVCIKFYPEEIEFIFRLKKYKEYLKRERFDSNDRFLMIMRREKDKIIGESISSNVLSTEFSKICEELGLGPLRFHLLRHSFASRLRAVGVPTMYILKTMGHLLPEVTYNHYINNLDLIQREELYRFWEKNPLIEKLKFAPLLRGFGLARQSFYAWAKKNGKLPSFEALLEYLRS
ncbi:MAG: tyrosine-type recombinase/integrase [Candidatus Aminicenantes bacterium]|nr:tyrosine-type recombinase/integrase [Candidatus Aminicenantes bacterium]